MMTALLIFVTAGQASVAMAPGKWASAIRILRAADALGDISTYAGKVAQLPGKVTEAVRRQLGKGSEGMSDAVDDVLDAEGGAARAITNAVEPSAGPRRGNKGNKPKMETETVSLDGHVFHNDFRTMSGSARHVIRQLEARGWVRVSEILPEDLVQISKWFGKEIGVVQTPYGRLRIILGQDNGIAKKQLFDGEVFVMHTHPVVTSDRSHFTRDLAKGVDLILSSAGRSGTRPDAAAEA